MVDDPDSPYYKRQRTTSPPAERPAAAGGQTPATMLILVGLQGAGKSTFASALIQRSSQSWARICQDTIAKGRRGTKEQCIAAAETLLGEGTHVMIDRTNATPEQRAPFIAAAHRSGIPSSRVHCLFLDLPKAQCALRAAQRASHEGGVHGNGAYGVVGSTNKQLVASGPPSREEGFSTVLTCVCDEDVEAAAKVWAAYGAGCTTGSDVDEKWRQEGGGKTLKDESGPGNKRSKNEEKEDKKQPRIDRFFGKKGDGERGAAGKQQEEGGHAAAAGSGNEKAPPPEKGDQDAFSGMLYASKQPAQQPAKKRGGDAGSSGGSRHKFAPHFALSALLHFINDPEARLAAKEIVSFDSQCVVVPDKYPKARYHALVLARDRRLAGSLDLAPPDAGLVRHMKEVGLRWAGEQRAPEGMQFALGFHSVPSMRQLHLHVISKDYESNCLKTKAHWNSFTSEFFLDVDWVLAQLEGGQHLEYDVGQKEALLKAPLRCHRCRVELRNMPELKRHIVDCRVGE